MELRKILVESCTAVRMAKFWKELMIMTLGMLVTAVGVNYFLFPSNVVDGSVTGLSIVITKLFAKVGIDVRLSLVIMALNTILLLLAYFLIGPEFGIKTIFCAEILGPLLELCEKVCPVAYLIEPGQTSIMNDTWFDMVCYILLVSISQAILFRINASTGGMDIIAKILNKFLHFDIGPSVSIAGAAVCISALSVNPLRLVLLGLICIWINGIVVDYFTASLNRRKRVCIIANEHEAIHRYIINNLKRGCSLYELTGGYSGEKQTEIQALLTKDEFSSVMEFVRSNSIKAFITAGNVSEIYGQWYNHKNKKRSRYRTFGAPDVVSNSAAIATSCHDKTCEPPSN